MTAVDAADLERGIVNRLQQIEGDPRLKLAHGRWQSREVELKERIFEPREPSE